MRHTFFTGFGKAVLTSHFELGRRWQILIELRWKVENSKRPSLLAMGKSQAQPTDNLKQCLSIMLELPFKSRWLRISISEDSAVVCITGRPFTPPKSHSKIACSTEETVIGIPLIFALRKPDSETYLRHLSDMMNYYPEISQSALEILWADSI